MHLQCSNIKSCKELQFFIVHLLPKLANSSISSQDTSEGNKIHRAELQLWSWVLCLYIWVVCMSTERFPVFKQLSWVRETCFYVVDQIGIAWLLLLECLHGSGWACLVPPFHWLHSVLLLFYLASVPWSRSCIGILPVCFTDLVIKWGEQSICKHWFAFI